MISLNSNDIHLEIETQSFLSTKQASINQQTTFALKVVRAKSLWNGKKGSNAGKQAFQDIFEKLIIMCVGVEICIYCENNEAIDIEHFYPKSLFPEKTFVWPNYLLACKKCNTHHKSDKFAVFFPVASTTRFDIPRATSPPSEDTLLINPRNENPMDFLWLDIEGRTFRFTEKESDIDSRAFKKATYTLELLELNDREALVNARKQAAKYYVSRLDMYNQVKQSTDFIQLANAIDDFLPFDRTLSFPDEKTRVLNAIKEEIRQYCHPTVWQELKRQRKYLSRTNQLFQAVPEALNW